MAAYQDLIFQAGFTIGYIVIFLIIFAESGILIGFFLPGDSLLISLGIFASQSSLSLPLLILLGSIAAILGDSVGYAFGRKIGPSLFKREDSFFFRKENLQRAHDFYVEHGKKTIVLARFIPIVRTFAPIVAGIGEMEYSTFLAYNVVGGIGWVTLVTLLGYFLGTKIPNLEHYILQVVAAIVILSLIPVGIHLFSNRPSKR